MKVQRDLLPPSPLHDRWLHSYCLRAESSNTASTTYRRAMLEATYTVLVCLSVRLRNGVSISRVYFEAVTLAREPRINQTLEESRSHFLVLAENEIDHFSSKHSLFGVHLPDQKT